MLNKTIKQEFHSSESTLTSNGVVESQHSSKEFESIQVHRLSDNCTIVRHRPKLFCSFSWRTKNCDEKLQPHKSSHFYNSFVIFATKTLTSSVDLPSLFRSYRQTEAKSRVQSWRLLDGAPLVWQPTVVTSRWEGIAEGRMTKLSWLLSWFSVSNSRFMLLRLSQMGKKLRILAATQTMFPSSTT